VSEDKVAIFAGAWQEKQVCEPLRYQVFAVGK